VGNVLYTTSISEGGTNESHPFPKDGKGWGTQIFALRTKSRSFDYGGKATSAQEDKKEPQIRSTRTRAFRRVLAQDDKVWAGTY